MSGFKTRIIGVFGSGTTVFDGQRAIKAIPSVGFNPGTENVVDFLEAAFYPFVKAAISINSAIAYYEKGIAQNIAISGVVTANDETIFTNARIERTAGANISFAAQAGAYNATANNTTVDTDYIAKIETGSGGTITSASKQVRFVFPFLSGMNGSILNGDNLYSSLTKTISPKSNKSITLNGSNQYIYFAYPSSYGNLSSIKDQNGFTVTGSFSIETVNILVAGGLTESYKVYRTVNPTTVNNAVFTFNF